MPWPSTGTVVSISEDGKEVTLNHAEIEGLGMKAMTMPFGVSDDVTVSDFVVGDAVTFSAKKTLDGSFVITAMSVSE